MIKVLVHQKDGNLVGMKVSGHAQSDEYGKDIVCASISVLAQTCLLALDQVAKIEDILFTIDDGFLTFTLPERMTLTQREKANVIIESILVGIKGTQEMYPEYIRISEREVRPDDV